MSTKENVNEMVYHVKAVQGVIHAFLIALETLNSPIAKRILVKEGRLYAIAKKLKVSLDEGSKEVEISHKQYCKQHGERYVNSFTESRE